MSAVDYLLLGHVTRDLLPDGERLGGSVSYAALTARALGKTPAILTACEASFSLDALNGIPVERIDSEKTTTFENLETDSGRVQYLRAAALPLDFDSVPPRWRTAEILHLAPVLGEVPSALPSESFSYAFLGLTPQGWLRRWDETGRVFPARWTPDETLLRRADAVILSAEDIDGDESMLRAMTRRTKTLLLTEGRAGARLFQNGEESRIAAPSVPARDSTGAGDIFASAFFILYAESGDARRAAKIAACLAAQSVTRFGLEGIPTPKEIQFCSLED